MNTSISSKTRELFSQYRTTSYQKGEVLVQADEDLPGVFFIESGSVMQYRISEKGQKVIVNSFYAGAFFPISWAINNTQNSYFFEAMEKTTVQIAPKKDITQFLQTNPDVVYDLLGRVFSGVDGVLARTAHLMGSSAYVRVMYELLIQAKRRAPGQIEMITLPISEAQLSEHCGLAKETVSREFKKLKKNGLVSVAGGAISITNLSILEKEIQDNS